MGNALGERFDEGQVKRYILQCSRDSVSKSIGAPLKLATP